jgi:hypothetical protein
MPFESAARTKLKQMRMSLSLTPCRLDHRFNRFDRDGHDIDHARGIVPFRASGHGRVVVIGRGEDWGR